MFSKCSPKDFYLVRTSSLHLLIIQESSKRMGNQPFIQTWSPSGTFFKSSLPYSTKMSGFSATNMAQCLMSPMASIEISGEAELQANSDKHLMASWNESSMLWKYFSAQWRMMSLTASNARFTMRSSFCDAARWNTPNMFFQPDLMFCACDLTIWATHCTTMSLIEYDLNKLNCKLHYFSQSNCLRNWL